MSEQYVFRGEDSPDQPRLASDAGPALRPHRLALMATVAAALLWPDAASAGFLFFGWGEPQATQTTGSTQPRRRHLSRRQNMRLPDAPLKETAKPQGPLVIAISISKQRLKVYDANGLFAEAPVSTGMAGHSTPMGVFSIIQKHKWHRSNIYSGAPMPYMQRITWSGVALHQGVLPGYPASHGCIRMPADFAIRLWGWTKMGARVIVAPDEISPADFSHAKLIAQMLPAAPVASATPAAPTAALAAVTSPAMASAHHLKADRLAIALPSSPLDAQANAHTPRKSAGEPPHTPVSNPDLRTADASDNMARQNDGGSPPVAAGNETDGAKAPEPPAQTDAVAAPLTSAQHDTIIVFDSAEDVSLAVVTDFAPATAQADRQDQPLTAAAELPAATAQPAATETDPPVIAPVTPPAVAETDKPAPAAAERSVAETEKRPVEPLATDKAQDRLAAPAIKPDALDKIAAPAPIVSGGAPRPEAEPAKKPALAEKKRSGHIAVFISRKERRLFVRQGFEPLFDVPVEIAEADKPLGTHVFTARGDADSASGLRWSALSLPVISRKAEAESAKHGGKARAGKAIAARPDAAPLAAPALPTAAEALDRISIPEETLQRIAMAIQPGGSIIISDTGLGGETGLGTDFIVPLRQ